MKSNISKFNKGLILAGAIISFVIQGSFVSAASGLQTSVTTYAQTNVTQSSAQLNGAFYALSGTFSQVRFDYGTTPSVLSHTSYQTVSSASGTFQDTISLTSGQTYYFRAMGIDSTGTPYFGTTLSFIAPSYQLPSATTYAQTNVSSGSATLNGYFASNGSTTETYFEYANNSSFIGQSETSHTTQSASSGNFSSSISLSSGSTYYFRAVAKNPAGITRGSALSFIAGGSSSTCTIDSFYGSPSNLSSGSSSTLYWETSNCTSVSINSIGSGLALDGSANTGALYSTTTYTLTASNGSQQVTDTETITVGGTGNQCTIDTFYANPSSINTGSSTTIYWSTSNCYNVSISNYGSAGTSGSFNSGALYGNTTYTLSASGTNGSPSQSFTVNVGQYGGGTQCVINSFYANPSTVTSGQNATLYWSTSNCYNASISSIGSVNTSGSATTGAIYSTTAYTLSAYGSTGNPTQSTYVYTNQNGGCTYSCPPYYPPSDPVNPPYTPPTIIYVNGSGTSSGDTVTVSTSSISSLSIQSQFADAYIGDIYSYVINYKNIGKNSLDNATLTVTLPQQVVVRSSSTGLIDFNNHQVTISLGTLSINESGSVTVMVELLDTVRKNEQLMAKAVLTGINRGTGRTDTLSAYAVTHVKNGLRGNNLSAAAIFGDDVLPTTFGGWILTFIILAFIVYIGRQLYKKSHASTYETHAHH